jgi:hypothetical protein
MEVGQGPNWGCSAPKKIDEKYKLRRSYRVISSMQLLTTSWGQIFFSTLCIQTSLFQIIPLRLQTKFHVNMKQEVKLLFYIFIYLSPFGSG